MVSNADILFGLLLLAFCVVGTQQVQPQFNSRRGENSGRSSNIHTPTLPTAHRVPTYGDRTVEKVENTSSNAMYNIPGTNTYSRIPFNRTILVVLPNHLDPRRNHERNGTSMIFARRNGSREFTHVGSVRTNPELLARLRSNSPQQAPTSGTRTYTSTGTTFLGTTKPVWNNGVRTTATSRTQDWNKWQTASSPNIVPTRAPEWNKWATVRRQSTVPTRLPEWNKWATVRHQSTVPTRLPEWNKWATVRRQSTVPTRLPEWNKWATVRHQ